MFIVLPANEITTARINHSPYRKGNLIPVTQHHMDKLRDAREFLIMRNRAFREHMFAEITTHMQDLEQGRGQDYFSLPYPMTRF